MSRDVNEEPIDFNQEIEPRDHSNEVVPRRFDEVDAQFLNNSGTTTMGVEKTSLVCTLKLQEEMRLAKISVHTRPVQEIGPSESQCEYRTKGQVPQNVTTATVSEISNPAERAVVRMAKHLANGDDLLIQE